MHIYYETNVFSENLEDKSVKDKIKNTEDIINAQKFYINKLEQLCRENEEEKHIISQTMAKFAMFLKNNSISVFSDHYADYIDHLISRETKSKYRDNQRLERYLIYKEQYEQESRILEGLASSAKATTITPKDIADCVQQLYSLKNNGPNIKQFHETQQQLRKQNYFHAKEYRHSNPFVKPRNRK